MYQLLVFLHIVAAAVWLGGMLFLALVLVPARARLDGPTWGRLVGDVGRRFSKVCWVCLAVLGATGVLNLLNRGLGWEALSQAAFWSAGFGLVLAIKLALVAAAVGLGLAHDLALGPAAARAIEAGDAPTAVRRWATHLGRLNALLALTIVFLAVLLVRGMPS